MKAKVPKAHRSHNAGFLRVVTLSVWFTARSPVPKQA